MNKNKIINFICSMPKTFHEKGDVSMLYLFVEAGGQQVLDNISELEISMVLETNPEYIDSWVQLSEDNRSRPSYFFRYMEANSSWEVGYYPNGESVFFKNNKDACANYILKYLNQLSGTIK
jgi:hypothetical protein